MARSFLCLLALLLALFPLPGRAEEHRYVQYAEFSQDTQVDLSDGSRWAMDKGDCFPIYMFREHQTKVILTLGSATFTVPTTRIRVMKDAEATSALTAYRKNLESFLKIQADRWKRENPEAIAPRE